MSYIFQDQSAMIFKRADVISLPVKRRHERVEIHSEVKLDKLKSKKINLKIIMVMTDIKYMYN